MFRKKVALVLGGGGSRGFAHIGLLKALEEHQIPVDLIIGVSAGAIVGGLYAYYRSAEILEQKIRDFLFSEEFFRKYSAMKRNARPSDSFFHQIAQKVKERLILNTAATKIALSDEKDLQQGINTLFQGISFFEELRIPFICVASDLISGEPVFFTSGNLQTAIRASSSIPGIFPPVPHGNWLLVDGAATNNLPADYVRNHYPNYLIIASDVSENIDLKTELDSAYDIVVRSSNILQYNYQKKLRQFADIVIRHEVGNFHWSDFDHFDQLVRLGYEKSLQFMPEIRQKRKFPFSFRKFICQKINRE